MTFSLLILCLTSMEEAAITSLVALEGYPFFLVGLM
jgi:hypothetical protein